MSSLDSLTIAPLPAVIGTVNTTSVGTTSVGTDSMSSKAPASNVSNPSQGGKTLILCGKVLSSEDQAIFAEFGQVVVWQDKFLNVSLDQIPPFDYLIFDMSSKNARLTLRRTDLTQYNVISYVSVLQKVEDFIEQVGGTVITSIPKEAINKQDFDQMLQNEKLVSPSVVKSVLKWALACIKK